MSDSKLTEARRRWQESGSSAAHATYLRERMRAGELERLRVEVAAHFGHEGARLALGDEAPEIGTETWEAWHRAVAVAVGERLLRPGPLWTDPPLHLRFDGPADTNDALRFRPPTGPEIRGALGEAPRWIITAEYGESEEVLIVRAPTGAYPSLAHFWVEEVALRDAATVSPWWRLGMTPEDLGLAPCTPLRSEDLDRRAHLGPNRRLSEVLGPTPVVEGYRFEQGWDDRTCVWRTESEHLCHRWMTSA